MWRFSIPRDGGPVPQLYVLLGIGLSEGVQNPPQVTTKQLEQMGCLYEAMNMTRVVGTIHALGRAGTKGFQGPVLGLREGNQSHLQGRVFGTRDL